MNVTTRTLRLVGAGFLLAALQSVSFAQSLQGIAVTYLPAATATTAIPTLSEWGLIGLSLLLAVVAVYALRAGKGAKPLAAVMLASSLALGAIGSGNLVGEAQAAGVTNASCPVDGQLCYMTVASGGTVTVETVNSDVAVINNTGVAQTITGVVELTSWDHIYPTVLTPQCTVSLVLQPGATCYIYNNSSA